MGVTGAAPGSAAEGSAAAVASGGSAPGEASVTSVDVGSPRSWASPSPSAWACAAAGRLEHLPTLGRLGGLASRRSQPRHQVLGHARRGGLARHPHLLQRPQQLLAGDPELLRQFVDPRRSDPSISSISLPTSFGRRPVRNALPSTPAPAAAGIPGRDAGRHRGPARPGRIDRRSRRSRRCARVRLRRPRATPDAHPDGLVRCPSLRRRRLLGLLDLRGSSVDAGGASTLGGAASASAEGAGSSSAVDLDAGLQAGTGTASAAGGLRRSRGHGRGCGGRGGPRASSATWVSDLMSMRQPVSRAASRAFCPPSRSRVRVVVRHDHHGRARALVDADLLDLRGLQRVRHELGRVLRPRDHVDLLAAQLVHDHAHARALRPDAGTHRVDPGSFESTPIFDRCPGSRATALISTMPSSTSGTSIANRAFRSPGCDRLTTICGPFVPLRTSVIGLETLAVPVRLGRHLLGLGQQRLDLAEIEQACTGAPAAARCQ